jgi:hypothetical protein
MPRVMIVIVLKMFTHAVNTDAESTAPPFLTSILDVAEWLA